MNKIDKGFSWSSYSNGRGGQTINKKAYSTSVGDKYIVKKIKQVRRISSMMRSRIILNEQTEPTDKGTFE